MVSSRSIRRYCRRRHSRPPSQSWRAFLANHAQAIWAADLLVVQTLTFQTLYVIFFISHGSRQLVNFEVTAHPTAAWVWRQLIEATPWDRKPRFLIHDRDRVWGADFSRLRVQEQIDTVGADRVVVLDGSAYFNRPGPRLVDSLELLVANR